MLHVFHIYIYIYTHVFVSLLQTVQKPKQPIQKAKKITFQVVAKGLEIHSTKNIFIFAAYGWNGAEGYLVTERFCSLALPAVLVPVCAFGVGLHPIAGFDYRIRLYTESKLLVAESALVVTES